MRQCQEPRKEFFVNGKRYEAYLHGRGCNVFDGQINIDWDFDAVGYGINPHLLSYYIEQSAPELNKLYPEASQGIFAVESAVNELAAALHMDLNVLPAFHELYPQTACAGSASPAPRCK